MRILILGTSNSILADGWVHGLRAGLPDADIENLSVGGSPGIQFASRIPNAFHSHDCVIFDSIVNDENLKAHVGSESHHRNILYEILATIASQTRLITLGFTSRRFLEKESPEYGFRRSLTHSLGAEFIGFREIILTDRQTLEAGHGELYEDPAHVRRTIAFQLGRSVAQALRDVPAARCPNAISKDYSAEYRCVEPADLKTGLLIKRSNSRMSAEFRQLHEGDFMTLDPNQVLLGFYINAAQTMCSLRFRRSDESTYELLLSYEPNPGRLLKKFIPVPNGIKAVRFDVGTSVHGVLGPNSLDAPLNGVGGMIEISEMIYRKDGIRNNPIIDQVSDATPWCSLHQRVHSLLQSNE